MQSNVSKCWSRDMRIANWYENCKLIWKLQTHMKIANVHVRTTQRKVRIANWYENCKLMWKLQTDIRIAKQFSHFSDSSYVDVCNFLMRHSGNENLFWNRKNVSVQLRCGWQKRSLAKASTIHKYFNTNSYADTVWLYFKPRFLCSLTRIHPLDIV